MISEQSPQSQQDQLEKIFLSWNDIQSMLIEIKKGIISSTFVPDAIFTIQRGGLIPASALSYMLDIPKIYDIKIDEKGIVYSRDVIDLSRKSVLLVDNLVESGEKDYQAVKFLENVAVKEIMLVTLIKKEAKTSFITPHFSARSISKDSWAIFPWEALSY